ncbi:glutaredoxin domain-containing protein [Virgibacillus sp. 179-BFC.A HS]|uniref:Glutaredoxin domain-containing protein n=1 Tax=Tigheibacillus jepli TaxID=3035914 RepID=A0ABU5CD46_9BACI|nr:glutaredoxin domain-containing protein [Virgibacillus sp. 179-BFC.A HS]MDY0404257.1 glutaredoxin domain-containing protein [Virgibacillus sp. 179-BFC.A HS]
MPFVTVYTTSSCAYCAMLKNFLTDQNISFDEVNVENNLEMMNHIVRTTGQMDVPQSEVNGNWVVGYDPEGIMQAMNN